MVQEIHPIPPAAPPWHCFSKIMRSGGTCNGSEHQRLNVRLVFKTSCNCPDSFIILSHTVDGRNPKQPPGMYKNTVDSGINSLSTGAEFWLHRVSIYELCKPAYTIIHSSFPSPHQACVPNTIKDVIYTCLSYMDYLGHFWNSSTFRSTVNCTNNFISPLLSHLPSLVLSVSMGTKKSDSLGCVVSGGRKRCKPQPICEYSTNTDAYR